MPIATYGYIYRADGLIGGESGIKNTNYDYDGRKQITREGANLMDRYDPSGNRLWRSAATPTASQRASFDVDDQLLSDERGTTFQYDNNGNLLERRTSAGDRIRYSYDGANRLRSVDDGAQLITYAYDADGRLIVRTETGVGPKHESHFRYANRSILAELDDRGNLQNLYTRDDEGRLLRRRSRTALAPSPSRDRHSVFYLTDGLGSVVDAVDWDGLRRFSAGYDAWGNSAPSGQLSATEAFGYRGGYTDARTRLINFGARWYEPSFGRWLCQVPLATILGAALSDLVPYHAEISNLYRYAGNNPLGRWDPTGLIAFLPKGWPAPPGWKGGFWWKNRGRDALVDDDGETWQWHPEDEGHNEHWDKGAGRDKVRVDRNGKDLGERAFKPRKKNRGEEEQADEQGGGETAKRVGGVVAVGIGWEIGKWIVAAALAPETGFSSLGAALAVP